MSKSDGLRKRREGTVINKESSVQEKDLDSVINALKRSLQERYPELTFVHNKRAMLKDIVKMHKFEYPTEPNIKDESFLSPDGGFLYLKDTKGNLFPILISEVKKQGTNHTRALEGLPKQAKGNAIERLGKNVLGFKVMLKTESIFPFVCFCYGSDFEKGSSIIDRVVTIASFAELNKVHLKDTSKGEKIGSYFVRDAYWTNSEMYRACYEVASKSIEYYLAKYGNQSFSRI